VKVTRVRIEYEDGSAREVVGADDCEKWTTLVNAHAGLWSSRGWDPPALVNWREIPATSCRHPRIQADVAHGVWSCPDFLSVLTPKERGVLDRLGVTRKQTLRQQVAEFHAAMNQVDPTTPTIPSEERVRLRAALIAEEFFETMEAMISNDDLIKMKAHVLEICKHGFIRVNMPELADGMADLDYVVEGSRIEFGIVGEPIAAEVHRSNMAKFIGEPVWSSNGKRLKPAGWTPPDIAGELRKQGWKG